MDTASARNIRMVEASIPDIPEGLQHNSSPQALQVFMYNRQFTIYELNNCICLFSYLKVGYYYIDKFPNHQNFGFAGI